jgi:hypothetical protein
MCTHPKTERVILGSWSTPTKKMEICTTSILQYPGGGMLKTHGIYFISRRQLVIYVWLHAWTSSGSCSRHGIFTCRYIKMKQKFGGERGELARLWVFDLEFSPRRARGPRGIEFWHEQKRPLQIIREKPYVHAYVCICGELLLHASQGQPAATLS